MNTAPTIHLPAFEGPFDLLLHLIRLNEVDIYDIPIAQITEQYLDFLRAMEALDLEIASSFVVMAATLLAIKSKMLLPKSEFAEEEGDAEDARIELVQDLLEYMRYKEAAEQLQGLRQQSSLHYARPNAEELYINLFKPENPLSGKTLQDLSRAFAEVLAKLPEKDQVLDITREQVTIQEKSQDIELALKQKPRGLPFSEIFQACHSKAACVAAFLALLELIRQKKVYIEQSKEYCEIYLYYRRGGVIPPAIGNDAHIIPS